VYLHEQCWVVGNTARGRAAWVDDSELRLNRHAVVLDEVVLHRLAINIAGVQERRVEKNCPCSKLHPFLSQRSRRHGRKSAGRERHCLQRCRPSGTSNRSPCALSVPSKRCEDAWSQSKTRPEQSRGSLGIQAVPGTVEGWWGGC